MGLQTENNGAALLTTMDSASKNNLDIVTTNSATISVERVLKEIHDGSFTAMSTDTWNKLDTKLSDIRDDFNNFQTKYQHQDQFLVDLDANVNEHINAYKSNKTTMQAKLSELETELDSFDTLKSQMNAKMKQDTINFNNINDKLRIMEDNNQSLQDQIDLLKTNNIERQHELLDTLFNKLGELFQGLLETTTPTEEISESTADGTEVMPLS